MLLALFITVLLVYSLNFKRPDDRITRKEYDEALRHLKTKTELVYQDELKIISRDNQHVAMFESERQDLIKKAKYLIKLDCKTLIDDAVRMRNEGLITEQEFEERVNPWLEELSKLK